QKSMQNNLPPYLLRRDKRAKRIKLKVCPQRGIIVTVPYRFNMKALTTSLMPFQTWMLTHHQSLQAKKISSLPTEMLFTALNEKWRISYIESPKRLQTFIRPDHELVIFGQVSEFELVLECLTEWVKKYAGSILE